MPRPDATDDGRRVDGSRDGPSRAMFAATMRAFASTIDVGPSRGLDLELARGVDVGVGDVARDGVRDGLARRARAHRARQSVPSETARFLELDIMNGEWASREMGIATSEAFLGVRRGARRENRLVQVVGRTAEAPREVRENEAALARQKFLKRRARGVESAHGRED